MAPALLELPCMLEGAEKEGVTVSSTHTGAMAESFWPEANTAHDCQSSARVDDSRSERTVYSIGFEQWENGRFWNLNNWLTALLD